MRKLTAQEQIISSAILPLLEEGAYELVQVMFFRSPNSWILRIFVDREGGITVGECTKLAKEIRDIVSVEDIPQMKNKNYRLEVSSPGVERPLTKQEDFVKFTGRKVKVKTTTSVSGLDPKRKNFTGTLEGYSDENVQLKLEDEDIVKIPFEQIDKAHLVYEGEIKNGNNRT